jgi:hypothetical protein
MLYELGILFSIDELRQANYRAEAWKIFMQTCDPQRLAGSTLYESEATQMPVREEKVFCIAIQTLDSPVIDYVKAAFICSTAAGLMPSGQRFLEGGVTLRYPLSIRGQVDANGHFRSWQEAFTQRDKQLCLETGWKFDGPAKTLIATKDATVLF